METREIRVKSAKDQNSQVINSACETWGELKEVLASNGFDISGMDVIEGISKCNLNYFKPEEKLPSNQDYRGGKTDNLFIMIIDTNKKIKSGTLSSRRGEAYMKIRKYNLQDTIFEKYGLGYSTVATPVLEFEIVKYEKDHTPEDTEPMNECPVVKAFTLLVDYLREDDYLDNDSYAQIQRALNGKGEDSSEEAFNEAFDWMNE